jgi:two-component system, OmpR family, phosphate regulon response regulator PhoB
VKGIGVYEENSMRATILVIEEEPDLSKLFGILLRVEGYDVRLVRDWREARAALAEDSPDLIIFDWSLTNATGYLWADELRAAPETTHIPVLFVCGDPPSRGMSQLLGNAGIPVIEKPFDIFVFRKRVAALLTPRERAAGSRWA